MASANVLSHTPSFPHPFLFQNCSFLPSWVFVFSLFHFNPFPFILFLYQWVQLTSRVIPQDVRIHRCFFFSLYKIFCKEVWYIMIWVQVNQCFSPMFKISLFCFVALARYSELNFWIVLCLLFLGFLYDLVHLYSSTLAGYKQVL